jgi:plastocyanin
MARIPGRLPVLAAMAVALSACGGTATPAVTVEARNAEAVDSYRFSPETMSVPQGAVIHVVNKGDVEHNLTIDNQNIVIYTGIGQTAQATINLAPGPYTFQCTIVEGSGTHGQLGMKGTLTVTPKA